MPRIEILQCSKLIEYHREIRPARGARKRRLHISRLPHIRRTREGERKHSTHRTQPRESISARTAAGTGRSDRGNLISGLIPGRWFKKATRRSPCGHNSLSRRFHATLGIAPRLYWLRRHFNCPVTL